MSRRVVAFFVTVGLSPVVACGGDWENEMLVRDYCEYGSDTAAQMERCMDRVTADQVRRSNSNAAVWARDEGDCLADAGELCHRRLAGEAAAEADDSEECEPSYYYGGRGGC